MIEPIHLTTNNVARELLRISAQNAISSSDLNIEIASVKTLVKNFDSDFNEIADEDIYIYKSEEYLRNADINFEQQYDVTISSQHEDYPFKDMICDIELDENSTVAYLVIKKGSKLSFYDDLYSDFLYYITQQKVRSNILLYLFDTDYKQSIKEFVDIIQKIKSITFKEDKKIIIAQGLDEIPSINSQIFMNIEDSNDVGVEDSEGKVDYSNRGFLLSCIEGEQLFEFIKPQQGKHGRTCRGDIIEVETVNLDELPTFTVDDGIEIQDSFENIKYLSNKSGYLIKKGNQYDVSNSIDVDEISFKTTGTINTDLESEISINVIKNNPLEDAIEEGMSVKVQKLSIQGSVGRNTEIEARDISISGQSHNDSFIKCVNANIGVHKGKILGRKIEVNSLEGGEIIADTVIINRAMQGKIKAKTIEINTLGSYVTMESSEYIQIDTTKGEENKFIIDPSFHSVLDENKEDDESYFKNLESELKVLLQNFKDITIKLKNNLKPCEKIKAAIIKNKKLGIKIPSPLIEKFKTCKVMRVHYKKLKEDVEYKKDQHTKLKKKLLNNGSDIFDAKIVFNKAVNGYNHISYKLNDPQREIKLNTDETMRKKVFKLIYDEDGVLKIVNTDI